MSELLHTSGLLGKLKFPKGVMIGLLGVTLFLIGDGIESVWITDFVHTQLGFELNRASLLLSAYGIGVAICSFLAMALSDAIGPRRVMLIGLVTFLIFDVLFITVAIPSASLPLLIAIYAARSLGYPFFAMGFFAWLMKRAKPEEQSPISGWFFFFFSLGIQVLGSLVASALLPIFGPIPTLWAGWLIAIVGGALAIIFMRGPGVSLTKDERKPIGMSLFRSLSIVYRRPKVGLATIIGIINLTGVVALFAFYVTYLHSEIHLDEASAVLIFTVFGIFTLVGNVIWGNIGNAVGWVNSVRYFASILSAGGLLYLYYVPMVVGPNFWAIAIGGAILGLGISAFVPLTALFIAHAEGEPAAGLAASSLARGLAGFVGPAVVAIVLNIGGYAGVIWVCAALYLSIIFIAGFIQLPGKAKFLTATPPAPATADILA